MNPPGGAIAPQGIKMKTLRSLRIFHKTNRINCEIVAYYDARGNLIELNSPQPISSIKDNFVWYTSRVGISFERLAEWITGDMRHKRNFITKEITTSHYENTTVSS